MLINLCHPPGMRRQFVIQTDARTLLFAADFSDAPPVVVVQIQTVAVTVAQHFQPLALRVMRVGFKQKKMSIIAADKPVPLLTTPYCQSFTGAVKSAPRQHGFHIQPSPHTRHKGHAVFVRVTRCALEADFIHHAPALTEHPIRAFVTTAVHTLPVQRKVARQAEIEVIIISQVFGPGGGVDRMREGADGLLRHHAHPDTGSKTGDFRKHFARAKKHQRHGCHQGYLRPAASDIPDHQ
ncbi:hypothetical protein C3999_03099 [Escherichia marmotae]|nr:hypothetical protein C4A10_02775 [Escherichia marmotae]RDR53701.1 hypothetical protein C4A06_02392 [Escherichia marmotae]RDR88910.1 hypothetical protein C3998_02402 [Escherichia marmotae]RDR90307.1 hypothetical protein C3999_03099 [Escherichia marmotae]